MRVLYETFLVHSSAFSIIMYSYFYIDPLWDLYTPDAYFEIVLYLKPVTTSYPYISCTNAALSSLCGLCIHYPTFQIKETIFHKNFPVLRVPPVTYINLPHVFIPTEFWHILIILSVPLQVFDVINKNYTFYYPIYTCNCVIGIHSMTLLMYSWYHKVTYIHQ